MLNVDGVITASQRTRHTQCGAVRYGYLGLMCAISTLPTTALCNQHSSWMRRMLGEKVGLWSTRHNAVRHDGQLDFTVWRVDWLRRLKLCPACAQTTLYHVDVARSVADDAGKMDQRWHLVVVSLDSATGFRRIVTQEPRMGLPTLPSCYIVVKSKD